MSFDVNPPQHISNEINWNIINTKLKTLKYRDRRKLIKKTKRKVKRKRISQQSNADLKESNVKKKNIIEITDSDSDENAEIKALIPFDCFSVGSCLQELKLSCIDEELASDKNKQTCNNKLNGDEIYVRLEPNSISIESSTALIQNGQNENSNEAIDTSAQTIETQQSDAKSKEIDSFLKLIDEEVKEWHNPYIQDVEPEMQTKDTLPAFVPPATVSPLLNSVTREEVGTSKTPTIPEDKRERCFFYDSMGCCRFGVYCQRRHKIAKRSNVILITGMFKTFAFEMARRANRVGGKHGDVHDLGLEFSNEDLYEMFKEFSKDVLEELRKFGRIIQFKVCCNQVQHLQGNVYVEYERKRMAYAALEKLSGRFYDGKRLDCKLVRIPSWKSAICGMFYRKNHCSHGDKCNFLHVFKDRSGKFFQADRDYYR